MSDVLKERRAGERRCEKVREKLAAAEAEVSRLQRELTEARADKLQAQRDRERAEVEVARLRAERAIIDRQLLKSNLDATRWFIMEALRGEGEK